MRMGLHRMCRAEGKSGRAEFQHTQLPHLRTILLVAAPSRYCKVTADSASCNIQHASPRQAYSNCAELQQWAESGHVPSSLALREPWDATSKRTDSLSSWLSTI